MVLGDNNQNRTFSIPTILGNSKQQFNKQQIQFFYSLTQFTILIGFVKPILCARWTQNARWKVK
jgi:hypothetical protein